MSGTGIAAVGAELALVDAAAGAGPLVGRSGLAAFAAEFAGVHRAAGALPFPRRCGLGCAALAAELAGVAGVSAGAGPARGLGRRLLGGLLLHLLLAHGKQGSGDHAVCLPRHVHAHERHGRAALVGRRHLHGVALTAHQVRRRAGGIHEGRVALQLLEHLLVFLIGGNAGDAKGDDLDAPQVAPLLAQHLVEGVGQLHGVAGQLGVTDAGLADLGEGGLEGRQQLGLELAVQPVAGIRLADVAADVGVEQQRVLEALRQGDLRVSELTAEYGSLSSTLSSLEKKGVIRIEQRRRLRSPEDQSEVFSARTKVKPLLTQDQQHALSVIENAAAAQAGEVVLIDGVTGSGKTEVYLCAIEQALAQGKGAIVLVPEISLTPQTVARFRGRFGDMVAVLHSRMSQGERYDQWDAIRNGVSRVVVGARSALFAPLKQAGIIVIDEEHESSYKQDQAPRYVTRDVAQWLAREHGAVLVLGSATPSLEALERCACDPAWHKVEMPNRANGKPLPSIQVVDMAREFGGGNRSMFSRALQNALFEVIEKEEKAVLMLNQRGFAQFLLCRDCGFVPSCVSCSTSLTYHEREGKLVCHHCGFEQRVPLTCPKCGSPYLKRFGAGTQRVESELRSLLSEYSCDIIRMDADTTSRKGDHQRLLEQFAKPGAAVLLGTQMIAKGLDFDEVTLVGVINADTMLKLPDFRSAERTFDLIEQVAGRAGRAEKSGMVIVQTYSAQDPAIRAAARYDRQLFLDRELELRKGLGYPPFVRLANVLVWGKDEDRVKQVAHTIYADLAKIIPRDTRLNAAYAVEDIQKGALDSSGGTADFNGMPSAQDQEQWLLLPPTPCVLERLKGSWRYHLVIKAPSESSIAEYVGSYFRQRKPEQGVRVSIDIDPINLL